MVGIYFSGTGNTRHCVEAFMREYGGTGEAYSIESDNAVQKICADEDIVIGYPVQFSSIPKILQDFIAGYSHIWNNKRIFIIATMGLFSGDGAGILARLLRRHGAMIVGGLHLKMPDSIGDERALKRTLAQNQALVLKAEQKIKRAVQEFKRGCPPQDGIGFLNHMAGLLGQRLYFYHKTRAYSNRLKIDKSRCIRCGKCALICPMKNISLTEGQAIPKGKCTMCYRCINFCPVQAITLLGKRVYEQCHIEQYL